MNDRAVSLLEQYDIEVLRTKKGRGAIICDTNRGCLIYKEYMGNENRLQLQNKLLTYMEAQGEVKAESIIPTKEGALFVKDNDGVSYILKTYREGRECNIYDKEECVEAVSLLARMHRCLDSFEDPDCAVPVFSQEKEYSKRNRELKKVRKYLQQRSQKTWFEIQLLHTFDFFLNQALAVAEEWGYYQNNSTIWEEASSPKPGFCHGDYQYHNIIKEEKGWFLINFEKCIPDDPIRDLYLLLRKLLEKGNWSISLGNELLKAYEAEYPISAMSRNDLYYRLAYPEKFWKIVNFYYNSGKAWIPERNQEKLDKLIAQEQAKQNFLDEVFRNVRFVQSR